MTKSVSAILSMSLAVLGSSRCGGESDTVAAPARVPDEPPSAEASALAAAQCDYLERCDPDAMYLFPRNARPACEEFFACTATTPLERLASPSALEDCIESLTNRECPDVDLSAVERFSYAPVFSFPWGPACGVPDLADQLAPPADAPRFEEPCIRGGERAVCEAGAYCATGDAPPAVGLYYCGICDPLREDGEGCDDGTRCVGGTVCVAGACQEVKEAGEPCALPDECRFRVCEGSICGHSSYAPTPYGEVLGRGCDEDAECGNQAALWCRDGTCSALPNEGEPCGSAVRLYAPSCRLGHACVRGTCIDLGCSIDLGEPCDSFCDAGDCVAGVCVPAGEIGNPCDFSCGNGLWCLEGRCDIPGGEENGAPCDFDFGCASAFCERDLREYCDGGSCSIPACDLCGVCADPPTVEVCE